MALKSVLITGGTGSFGKTMLTALLDREIEEIRILSRDEEKQDALRNQLNDPRVKFHIGDVRARDTVDRAVAGVDAIFHAAALKQVPSCEFFPLEAIRTNVLGSENVIRSAIDQGVRRVVCLSTDKAVLPINAMGMSKAMMEKIAQSHAREMGPDARTILSCVRYGNVMCSRGSVIPLFMRQIREGRPLSITAPEMTRFLMPLRDSVSLVLFALENSRQGDLFVRKASAATIGDLVIAIRNIFGVPDHETKVIGWRHAEKLFETLATKQELEGAEDMGDYWRLQIDQRDLNYGAYFDEGSTAGMPQDDFHSHNAERLDVPEVEALLLSLPEVRQQIAAFKAGRG